MKYLAMTAIALALTACGGNDTTSNTMTTDTAMTDDMGMAGGDMNAMAMNGMAAAPGGVTVTVSGVQPGQGPVLVALQEEGQFASLAGAHTATVEGTGDTATATIQNVPAGRYAAAAFQDTNSDGTTTIGPRGPSEPWGFSGSPQSGAPAFAPATFEVTGTGGTATIALKSVE